MKSILTQEERGQIAALVAQVEAHTASEIVTVVFSKSDNYAAFRIGYGAVTAVTTASVLHLLSPTLPPMELLGSQTVVALLTYWLLGLPSLLRLVVPRWAKNRAVYRQVRQLFLELGVTETRDRSGVLIYLSELERRIEILGDRGIHEHLGKAAWEDLVKEVVGAIHRGRAAEGLIRIIERLGTELKAKFPVRPDDTNELPNAVVTDLP